MTRALHIPRGGVRKPTFAFDLTVELPGGVEDSTGRTSKIVGSMPRNLLGRGFSAAEGALI